LRQTIAFQATGFDCSPVQVELEEDGEAPEEGMLPVAMLAFESGGNVVLTLPLATSDAENMMNAFTQAEPYRQAVPDAGTWQPQAAGLPEGLFWALQPAVVGVSVTPPQNTADGVVPHWTLAFDDEDGSQVQIAVSDPMTVQVVNALAQVARGEIGPPAGADG
jgi:phosphotransferase system HPr-like phosphotransfer protein